MTILELSPIQPDKSQTNSSDIQKSLNELKEDDILKVLSGEYLIDDSQKGNSYGIIAVPSGVSIEGEVGYYNKPSTIFKLMDNAPLNPFICSMPILGPAEATGKNITIKNLKFNGNCPRTGYTQKYFKNGSCAGTSGNTTDPAGKGFSNFIGTYTGAFQDCTFDNIWVVNSAGDGFRTYKKLPSSNLTLTNWRVEVDGHCCILLENTTNALIKDCYFVTYKNGGFRFQNGCSDITVDNVTVVGNQYDYNPGAQVTAENLLIKNCKFSNTLGPGLEILGENNKNVTVKDCSFVGCGQMPAAVKVNGSSISGIGGILTNGADVLIENCYFDGNYGKAVTIEVYTPDGRSYTKSGFKVRVKNCVMLNTKSASYSLTANGKNLVNLLSSSHTLISENNKFYPGSNYSYGAVEWED